MPANYHLHLRGEVGYWNFDSEYTSYILDKYKDQEVHVLINSLGGRADAGLAIQSLFRIHGNVHVHFVGMNASAATIAAMGAKRITIDAGACFLVHKCLNVVFEWDWMNADQLEQHIAKLQKLKDDQDVLDGCIAGIYARRCRKPKDDLLALMKKGGWLTPEQAKDWGFVDEITDLEEDKPAELTESVASAMCSAGLPLPPLKMEKDSFFDRLRRFFTADKMPADSKPADSKIGNNDSITNQTISMEKFPLLAALFASAVSLSATGLSLDMAQVQSVEDSLAASAQEIADLKQQLAQKDKDLADKSAEIDSLNKSLADLKKAPAEETSEVKEQSKADQDDGPGDDIDAVVASLAKAFR